MLRELTIKDLAVVESLHLTFESGLTVLPLDWLSVIGPILVLFGRELHEPRLPSVLILMIARGPKRGFKSRPCSMRRAV